MKGFKISTRRIPLEKVKFRDFCDLINRNKESGIIRARMLGAEDPTMYCMQDEKSWDNFMEATSSFEEADLSLLDRQEKLEELPPETITVQGKEIVMDYDWRKCSHYQHKMLLDMMAKVGHEDNHELTKWALAIYVQRKIDGKVMSDQRIKDVKEILEDTEDGWRLFQAGFFLLMLVGNWKKSRRLRWRRLRLKISTRIFPKTLVSTGVSTT